MSASATDPSPARRRRRCPVLVGLLVVAGLLFAACGSDDGDSSSTGSAGKKSSDSATATEAGSASGSDVEDGAYPVTITHKWGETEITEKPERVVTVGVTDQDALLALGTVPVGTTEWFGEQPGAIWPWATEHLGDAELPTVLDASTDNPQYEKIAALRPDVIVAVYSGLTKPQYEKLAKIAPTVAQPKAYTDWGVPWQEQTETIGRIVGRPAKAEELVADVEDQIAAAREANPDFEGKSGVVATPYEGIWIYGPEDARGRLLTTLGFTVPSELANAAEDPKGGGNISEENAGLLDLDLIIWLDPDDAEGQLGGAVYPTLDVHEEAREVYLDSYEDPIGAATSYLTVLSYPYLLENLVPRMALAVDGDPATKVPNDTGYKS